MRPVRTTAALAMSAALLGVTIWLAVVHDRSPVRGRVELLSLSNFLGNATVKIYAMPTRPEVGGPINGPAFTVRTDADGSVGRTTLGVLPVGGYWVVADYDNDGRYTPEFDAATFKWVR